MGQRNAKPSVTMKQASSTIHPLPLSPPNPETPPSLSPRVTSENPCWTRESKFMRWNYEENVGVYGEFTWNWSRKSNFEILGRECASLVAFVAHSVKHGNTSMLLLTIMGDQFLVMVQRELWSSYESIEDLFNEDGGVGLQMILDEERTGKMSCCSLKITNDSALLQFVSHAALMKKSPVKMHLCDRKIVLQMPLPLPQMLSFLYFDNSVAPSRVDVEALLRFVERAIEIAPQVPVLVHTHTGSYLAMVDLLRWNLLDDPMGYLKDQLHVIKYENEDLSLGFVSKRLLHVDLLHRLRVILAALGQSTLSESLPQGEELVAYTGNNRRALCSAVRRRLRQDSIGSSTCCSHSHSRSHSCSAALSQCGSGSFSATSTTTTTTTTENTRPQSASVSECFVGTDFIGTSAESYV